jgi:hypothetical protein
MHPTIYIAPLPTARLVDSGEELDAEILRGPALARAGIDIRGPVRAGVDVVAICVPVLDTDEPVQLRIPYGYAEVARTGDDGDPNTWKSDARPANAMLLPDGWHLVESSVPAIVSRMTDGQMRIEFDAPRDGPADILLTVRRRW